MAIYLGTDKVSLAGTSGGFMLNGRLIATKEYEFKLSDTNYSSLTISTTAQTLTLPATTYSNASTSITCHRLGQDYDGIMIDLYNHDYVIFFEQLITYAYSSSVSGTIHGIKSVFVRDQHEGRYYSSFNATTGQLNTSGNPTWSNSYITSQSRLLYQKADNTYGQSANGYGIKSSSNPASFGVSNSKGYINLTLSSIQAQANDSYFPVAAMDALNTTNTKIKSIWYIYEGDKSMFGQIYNRAYELATI